MFKKILIANRGEIACRIIRTARRMGIQTVAVYSEADAAARHVEEADEAVCIGKAQASDSYLNIEKIIRVSRETKAEAVHPGYGFLSENANFCRELEKNNIVFIGPPVSAIEALGDKIASKKLAQKAGVSTVPGYVGELQSADEAIIRAKEIGYPVILKASAGGGGKGMRIARSDADIREGLQLAQSEAKNSFGDARVFMEKYIENPRHIEVQILGDKHGNVFALFERECSLQRRHQKVIEEAPSPFLDEKTRKAMCDQAVMLAKAAGYFSAGTIEFIVAPDRKFYFLEMNTRLQVEHPVTELITGLDLVEQMLRVAAGEKLDIKLETPKGHAIEARVYAEDPSRNFLPSIGRLTTYRPPEMTEGLRLDDGVREGDEISMFYDPMIAKLISYGPDRATATKRMAEALDRFEIEGLRHNLTFLAALMRHPRFASFDFSTGFIGAEWPKGFDGAKVGPEVEQRVLAIAAAVHQAYAGRTYAKSPHEWVIGGIAVKVDGEYVHIGQQRLYLKSDWRPGQPIWLGSVDGHSMAVLVKKQGSAYHLRYAGREWQIMPLTRRAAELAAKMPEKAPPDMSKYLLSPMPGLLLRVEVKAGDEVKAGQVLAVVEAMKMENILRASHDGVVAKVVAQAGASLAVDAVILEFAA